MDIIANGVRLNYTELGKGFPVICAHGNGINKDVWRHLMPELSKKYRAIAYDLRAMGKSETPGKPGLTITFEDHARDLEGFMDALNIREAALVGHAFGSLVSTRFTIDHPERVRALVVVDTAPKIGGKTRERIPQWVDLLEREGVGPLIDQSVERWFVPSFHREHPEIVKLYRDILAANPPMGYVANFRGVLLYDATAELPKVKCPTLVVSGADDKGSTPPEAHKFIAGKIPNSRLVIIANASHTVPEEQVEEFNKVTLEFLNQNIPA